MKIIIALFVVGAVSVAGVQLLGNGSALEDTYREATETLEQTVNEFGECVGQSSSSANFSVQQCEQIYNN